MLLLAGVENGDIGGWWYRRFLSFSLPPDGDPRPAVAMPFWLLAFGLLLLSLVTGERARAAAVVCKAVDGSTLTAAHREIGQKFLLILEECRETTGPLVPAGGPPGEPVQERSAASRGEMAFHPLLIEARFGAPSERWSGRRATGSFRDEIALAVRRVAREYNIDPLLLHAIAHVESRHDPDAISPAGARGIIQVMPATARRFGVLNPERDLHDPLLNLRVGSAYLKMLQQLFGNDLPLVLAAYNAGEGAVIKYGRTIPPYRETRRYVRAVLEHYVELKRMAVSYW